MDAAVSRPAETFSQFKYWFASYGPGHPVDGAIRPGRVANDLPEHGQRSGLGHRHEVAKDVSDAPASAPRGAIPSIRRKRGYLVCELQTKPTNFPLGVHAGGGHTVSLPESAVSLDTSNHI